MSEDSYIHNGSSGGSVTTVVRAHIKPGKEPEYEEWLHGINEECSQFAGFQGATVFRPDDESHPPPRICNRGAVRYLQRPAAVGGVPATR